VRAWRGSSFGLLDPNTIETIEATVEIVDADLIENAELSEDTARNSAFFKPLKIIGYT